ncbi:hypothetical protein ACWKWU_22385 [Chitinophaga lutea]
MVTFETKCYENDWTFVLKGSRLERAIDRCAFPFSRRRVIINNVRRPGQVRRQADRLVARGVIDDYVLVEDYAGEVLAFFDLDKDAFNGGYYYSIAELTGIYTCPTQYLLHFASDTLPDDSRQPWIAEALRWMEERRDILVANPAWDFRFEHAEEESFGSIGNFYLGYGFSDQCYLVRTSDFRQPIYKEQHPLSARYPAYGGELFEKRVDSYMRNHQRYRITSKDAAYVHRNFPKGGWERMKLRLDGLLGKE